MEAGKQAARRAIEKQYARSEARPKGLEAGELEPVAPRRHRGIYNPPGYFGRGRLSGVVYPSHIRCSYL